MVSIFTGQQDNRKETSKIGPLPPSTLSRKEKDGKEELQCSDEQPEKGLVEIAEQKPQKVEDILTFWHDVTIYKVHAQKQCETSHTKKHKTQGWGEKNTKFLTL